MISLARLGPLAILLTAFAAGASPRVSRAPRDQPLQGQGTTNCGTGPGLAAIIAPGLRYCGGRVLSQARIVAVLWGPPDALAPTPSCSGTFQGCLDSYYRALVQSPQFDWIDEYQTTIAAEDGAAGTDQHIGRPTYFGSVEITPANTAAVVGEIDIENELVAQISAGHLPAPDADDETIYEVHFPLEVDPSDPCSVACFNFCAYHDSWRSNILGTTGIIAILPSHMPPGYPLGHDCSRCGSRTDWFANLGGSISHETFEAITDPDVGLSAGLVDCAAPVGWYDTSPSDDLSVHGEIGDMCEGLPDGTNSITDDSFTAGDGSVYTVQREWSNRFSACLGALGDAFSVSPPSGILLDEPGSTATFTISTTPPFDAGMPLPLKLVAHGLPGPDAGVTATFTPSVLDASGTSTLALAISPTAPQTSFTFAITGDSGDTLAETVLSVSAPDFSASLDQTALALTAGGPPAIVNLTTQAISGAGRGFALSTRGATGVVTSPDAGTLGTPLAVSLSALAGAPSISGTLSLNVVSAGVLHTLPLALTLSGDDAALSAPAALRVPQGGALNFTLSSSTRAGQPQTLSLTAINLPAGASATFAPPQITSGGTAQVSLAVPSSQPLATFSFTVVATGPLAQTTLNVPVAVTASGGCAEPGASFFGVLGLITGLLTLARGYRRRRAQRAYTKRRETIE